MPSSCKLMLVFPNSPHLIGFQRKDLEQNKVCNSFKKTDSLLLITSMGSFICFFSCWPVLIGIQVAHCTQLLTAENYLFQFKNKIRRVTNYLFIFPLLLHNAFSELCLIQHCRQHFPLLFFIIYVMVCNNKYVAFVNRLYIMSEKF